MHRCRCNHKSGQLGGSRASIDAPVPRASTTNRPQTTRSDTADPASSAPRPAPLPVVAAWSEGREVGGKADPGPRGSKVPRLTPEPRGCTFTRSSHRTSPDPSSTSEMCLKSRPYSEPSTSVAYKSRALVPHGRQDGLGEPRGPAIQVKHRRRPEETPAEHVSDRHGPGRDHAGVLPSMAGRRQGIV